MTWQLNIVRVKAIFSGRNFLEFGVDMSRALIKDWAQGIVFGFWNPSVTFVSPGSDRW